MDFNYLKKMYDMFNSDTLNSVLTVNATIIIIPEAVGQESFYKGFSDSLDARQADIIKKRYPIDLSPFYRVQVYKIEAGGVKLATNDQFTYGPLGRQEPYDVWISCEKSKAMVRAGKTFFDFSTSVIMEDIKFSIKGVVTDDFGSSPLIHIFLEKETSE